MKSKRPTRCGLALAVFTGVLAVSASTQAADPVERIIATTVAGKTTPAEPFTIDLLRWSTDAERSQFLPILSGKPTTDADALKKVSLGYVWGTGSIGHAVRYAERQSIPGGGDRLVLVVDRSLSSWQGKPNWMVPAAVKPVSAEPQAPPVSGRDRPYVRLLLEIGNDAYEGIKYEHERGVSNETLAKSYGVTVAQVEQVIKLEAEAKAAEAAAAERKAVASAARPMDRSPFTVVELRLTGATPQGKVAAATTIAADVSKGLTLDDAGAETVQLRGIKRGSATTAAAPAAAAPKAPAAAPKAPAK